MRTETVAIPLDGARDARVRLDISVGQLRLTRAETPGLLVSGTVELPDEVELEVSHQLRDETLRCAIAARFEKSNASRMRRGPVWRLGLAAGVPLRLDIESGVNECVLDLSALDIVEFDIHAGVGKTELTLPARGGPRGRIESGVGATVVRVPAALAARVRVSSGIGSVTVDGRFQRQASAWVTPGYDASAEHADVRIEAGIGSISVTTLG